MGQYLSGRYWRIRRNEISPIHSLAAIKKNQMYKFIFLLCALVLLQGCSLLGTRTLYKTKDVINVESVGYVTLLCDSARIKNVFPFANSVFTHEVDSIIKRTGEFKPRYIEANFCHQDPGKERINAICKNDSVDAVLLTSILFTKVLPYGYFDTEVYMTLYGKEGDVLLKTKHNTSLGNSTWKFPTVKLSIQMGVEGALNRMLQEMQTKEFK
jgi:hypothetical protein